MMTASEIQTRLNNLTPQDGEVLQWIVTNKADEIYFLAPDCVIPCHKNEYSPARVTISRRYAGNDPAVIRELFILYVQTYWPTFSIDSTNRHVIERLAEISAGVSNRRGLIISGNVGSGKTTLLLIWTEFTQKVLPKYRIAPNRYPEINPRKTMEIPATTCIYSPQRLIQLFTKQEKNEYSLFSVKHGDVLILDDIGLNPEINHYGTKTALLSEMILGRYEQWKEDQMIQTYCTTNLKKNQLAAVLGARATSRLIEMTTFETLAGDDRRLTDKTVKTWPTVDLYNPFTIKYQA